MGILTIGSKGLSRTLKTVTLCAAMLLMLVIFGCASSGQGGNADAPIVKEGKSVVSAANSELLFVDWGEDGADGQSLIISSDNAEYGDFFNKVSQESGVEIKSASMEIGVQKREVATNAGTPMVQFSYSVKGMELTTPSGSVSYSGGNKFDIK